MSIRMVSRSNRTKSSFPFSFYLNELVHSFCRHGSESTAHRHTRGLRSSWMSLRLCATCSFCSFLSPHSEKRWLVFQWHFLLLSLLFLNSFQSSTMMTKGSLFVRVLLIHAVRLHRRAHRLTRTGQSHWLGNLCLHKFRTTHRTQIQHIPHGHVCVRCAHSPKHSSTVKMNEKGRDTVKNYGRWFIQAASVRTAQ